MSSVNASSVTALRSRQKPSIGPLSAQKTGARTTRAYLISEELIADRLICMLKQIRSGRAGQVLLHSAVIASTLNLGYPNAQTIRDLVHEALACSMRGDRHLAMRRMQEAIDAWDDTRGLSGRVTLSGLRRQAARA